MLKVIGNSFPFYCLPVDNCKLLAVTVKVKNVKRD